MAAAALVLGMAACNDDDDGIDADDFVPVPTTAVDTTVVPATDASTTLPESTTSTSSPTGGSDLRLGSAGSWSAEAVADIELDDTNTAPVIDGALADERILDDHWVWDWWYVRDRDGEPADFDGTHVAIGLTAPADVLPGKRHDIAELRYMTSDDGGETWDDGGPLFESGSALGSRQWAGSAMYDVDSETLYAFYTAAGEVDEEPSSGTASTTSVDTATGTDMDSATTTSTSDMSGTDTDTGMRAAPTTTDDTTTDDMIDTTREETTAPTTTAPTTTAPTATAPTTDDDVQAPSGGALDDSISYRQGLALATATMRVDDDGVVIEDWSEHEMLIQGDDTDLYSSTESTSGGAGNIDAFRDPWYFRGDDGDYLLFTATMPRADCDGDGVVGIARATSDDLSDWELLPPLFDAHCVNNELERPHIIRDSGQLYLLFTTHSHTFRDGASGPEGYYGFVADTMDGPFEPLNGTGLVIANPPDAEFQAYSWMGHPDGAVTSFFQFFDIGEVDDIDYIGDQSPEFQREHFGGTFAPSLHVEFDGDTTRIVEELAPGSLAAAP